MTPWDQRENESDYSWLMDMAAMVLTIGAVAVGSLLLLLAYWMVTQ